MLFSFYERRLRQLSAPGRAGGARWVLGLAASGGDRRKAIGPTSLTLLLSPSLFLLELIVILSNIQKLQY